jgi:hypothetical protein
VDDLVKVLPATANGHHESASPVTMIRRKAYRILADAYEQQGQIDEAVKTLTDWAAVDTQFRSKIQKDIDRLVSSS